MNTNTIQFEIDENHIARVCLNQADKHNALSPVMMGELIAVFAAIAEKSSIRAVVLSGRGPSFCAGGDLTWMRENLDKSRSERIAESRVLAELFECIDSCPKLVIARVNGAAYGGGVGLICVCDIAIGVESANFALTEVKLGLVPANIAPYVIRKMGVAKLRRTALNALRFDARRAYALGLLDKVVPENELDQAVDFELKLALSAAPGAIARSKHLFAELDARDLDNTAEHLVEVLADAWEGDEAQAGICAFFDKVSPPWKSG